MIATTAGAATKPPLYNLILPEGFKESKATDKRGVALISRHSFRAYVNEQGIIVQWSMDNSNRATDADLAGHSRYFLEQIVEQSDDYQLVGPVRYTVSGKEWICLPFKAKDPEKRPDMMVLITQFNRTIATIQVGGRREVWDESKKLAAEILKLNSPSEVLVSKGGES